MRTRTFYQVWSSGMYVKPKRYAREIWAMKSAVELMRVNPGKKFYITQSVGRFCDGVYEPW